MIIDIVLLVTAYRSWSADRASRLGAGLAYYSLFALVPVLFLAISLAGLLFGEDVAGSAVEERIVELVGPELATAITTAVDDLRNESNEALLPAVSTAVLVVSASVLFVAWKEVVDFIWGVPKQFGILANVKRRLFGAAVIVAAGLLLALTVFAQTVLTAIDRVVDNEAIDALLRFTGSLAPTALGAGFLVLLFKFTPDVPVGWRSVVVAAPLTMVGLSVGAWAYGLYLGSVGFANASGVAGSVLLGLALVYYAAQILLFGVELTKVTQRANADRTRSRHRARPTDRSPR